jgi:hypothetical protein
VQSREKRAAKALTSSWAGGWVPQEADLTGAQKLKHCFEPIFETKNSSAIHHLASFHHDNSNT